MRRSIRRCRGSHWRWAKSLSVPVAGSGADVRVDGRGGLLDAARLDVRQMGVDRCTLFRFPHGRAQLLDQLFQGGAIPAIGGALALGAVARVGLRGEARYLATWALGLCILPHSSLRCRCCGIDHGGRPRMAGCGRSGARGLVLSRARRFRLVWSSPWPSVPWRGWIFA